MTVAQQSIPRGSDSPRITSNPAGRFGLHLIQGDAFDPRPQDSSNTPVSFADSLAAMDDSVERALYADVIAAMTDARAKLSCDDIPSQELRGSSLNAAVAGRLRAMGYDAAVCATQWDTSPTIPEASPPPTFTRTAPPSIVTRASPFLTSASSASVNGASAAPASAAVPQRFIIDVDFRAQFQIARPTREYAAALESTPLIFVGRSERLARLVEVVSGAMRGALRAQGMHVPPWRKWEYLHAKWMAAVSQRVVCEAKGVTYENFQSASGGAVGGDKEKAQVDGDGYARFVPARRFSALQQCARAGGF
ncbi:unnamed protein product [Closterium sp. Naga37s-1]|nr:unnamed protein product [Closterium sp. Naga37s-1]